MTPRLLADENTSHHLVAACGQLRAGFPLIHISRWQNGACLSLKDPALLMTLRDHGLILVGFDRASMPMHAGTLTREGVGHAGVILFRRSVPTLAYGRQARLLVDLMAEAKEWDWADRINTFPGYEEGPRERFEFNGAPILQPQKRAYLTAFELW